MLNDGADIKQMYQDYRYHVWVVIQRFHRDCDVTPSVKPSLLYHRVHLYPRRGWLDDERCPKAQAVQHTKPAEEIPTHTSCMAVWIVLFIIGIRWRGLIVRMEGFKPAYKAQRGGLEGSARPFRSYDHGWVWSAWTKTLLNTGVEALMVGFPLVLRHAEIKDVLKQARQAAFRDFDMSHLLRYKKSCFHFYKC